MRPREISHYRLLEKIGEGSFGEVHRAEDLYVSRVVVVKTLKHPSAVGPATRARFLREAEAIAAIDHPHVVPLYDVIREGDDLHLVLQWVGGGTLRDRIRQGGIDQEEAVRLVTEIARGLAAAHARGVVHRDLKPENVLMTPEGHCKLVDFGLAHLQEHTTLGRRGEIVGTPAYMAPEQRRGEEIDARADVYALGLILQELLSGGAKVPVRLRRLVARATSPAAEERPADARGFLEALHPSPVRARWVGAAVLLTVLFLVARPLFQEPPGCGRADDQPRRILVAPFQNTSQREDLAWLSTAIMDDLMGVLGSLPGYRLVSRQAVGSALQDRPLQTAGMVDERLVELAREVEVDYVVSGSYTPREDGLRLICQLQDFHRSEVLASWPRELGDLRSELLPAIDALGRQIARHLGAPLSETDSIPRLHTRQIDALKPFEEGMQRLQRSDIPRAAESFRRATAADSTYARAWLYLWRTAPDPDEQRGAIAQAMRYRHGVGEPLRGIIEAAWAENEDEVDQAIERYETVLASHPELPLVHQSLAALYMQRRRWLDAVGELEAARSLNPFDRSYLPELVYAYVESGRTGQAGQTLLRWRSRDGENPSLWILRCRFAAWTGAYDQALAYADTLAALRPGADLPHRSVALRLAGRGREAEDCLLRWMSAREGRYMRAMPLVMLADLDRVRGRLPRARERIDEALQDQDSYYAHWVAGLICVESGDLGAARGHAAALAAEIGDAAADTNVVEAYGERRFWCDLRGRIALAGGDPLAAVRWHRLARRASGRLDANTFAPPLARAYLAAGDTARARSALQEALQLDRSGCEPLLQLARLDLARGAREDARRRAERLREVLAGADEDFPAVVELRSLLDALGEAPDAEGG